jgi:predicted enzyme related to lactoylglutathione lyase
MSRHAITHIEIPGTDPQAAARFYGELCGWPSTHDATYDYTMFDAPPGPGGAFVKIDNRHAWQGQVLLHVATDDIDATLRQVEALGGKTLVPKTEVPGVVWFAVFADPSGNRIGLSTSMEGDAPPAAPPTAHPIVHVEIPATDPQEAARFYHAVFDWEIRRHEALDYTGFDIGDGKGGGGFQKIDGQATRAGQVVIYIGADDVEGMLGKASALGAQVAMPRMEIPEVGWFGMFIDPSGVPVGVFDPNVRA